MDETNICILGAGPGGVTTAITLAQQGIPCTLIEKAKFPRDKICGDALSGKVVEVLNKLDPDIVPRLGLQPTNVGSWGVSFVAPNLTELRVPFRTSFDKEKDTAPGFISKRLDFDHFLLQEALKFSEINYLDQTHITDFIKVDRGWELTTSDGQTIGTQILIVCDGAQSKFARQYGGIQKGLKHYCAGIRAYYSGVTGMDEDNFIELHFLKELLPGYFWIFPLPNGQANVGLGIRSDVISKKKINLQKKLEEVLQVYPNLRERFSGARLEGKIVGFGLPLGTRKRSISGDHYMLVGDAASLIDPFTGEGIGNAMMSGMLAGKQAVRCLESASFEAKFMKTYDVAVYKRLWSELSLSKRMQQLVQTPWLFNLVVNKAARNETLRETISCMFEDLDLRSRLKQPSFYLNLLFDKSSKQKTTV